MLDNALHGAAGTYNVCEFDDSGVLLVVPVSVIDPLPQELNGRLGPVLLLARHVEVIHKENTTTAHRRPVHSLASPSNSKSHTTCTGHTLSGLPKVAVFRSHLL